MKFNKKLLLTALLGLGAASLAAQDPTPDPVTFTLSYDTGSLHNGTVTGSYLNYNRYWVSTATNPQLTLDVVANNIEKQTVGTSKPGDVLWICDGNVAANKPLTFTFTCDEGWYVSSYSFDATAPTEAMTLITNDATYNLTVGADAVHVAKNLTYGTTPVIKITGNNKPVCFANFTVTLSPVPAVIEPDPALELDAMPAEDPNCAFKVTDYTYTSGMFPAVTALTDGGLYYIFDSYDGAGTNNGDRQGFYSDRGANTAVGGAHESVQEAYNATNLGDNTVLTTGHSVASLADANYVWRALRNENGQWCFQNVGTERYIGSGNNPAATPQYCTLNSHPSKTDAGYFSVHSATSNDAFDSNCGNGVTTLSWWAAPGHPIQFYQAMTDGDAYKFAEGISVSKYNDFTAWYHLQKGRDFVSGVDATEGNTVGSFDDAYLYCFVKDGNGYAVYNKAGGQTSLTYADGKVYDGTTELTAILAQQLLPIGTAYGKMYRDTSDYASTNAWRNNWVSNYSDPQVRFYGATNCLTTTASSGSFSDSGDIRIETGSNGAQGNYTWNLTADNNMYVYAYTFLAKKQSDFSEDCTITPNGGTAVYVRTVETRVEGTNASDLAATTFVQRAINGKGADLSDFYVTVRRILTYHNELQGVSLFPRSARGNERRIPAIATVGAGENEGRVIAVYDNRIHGGDIGGGNIGLEIAVSDDNGATWTEPDYAKDAEGNYVTKWNPDFHRDLVPMATQQTNSNYYWNGAYGDAAIVGDRESDRVLLISCAGPMNFFNGRRANPNQCARWYSNDGGSTWTPAEQITEQILSLFDGEPTFGYIDSQFIGSGKIMQSRYVKIGDYYRLYAVSSSQNNGGTTRNWVLFSDDFGMTWAVLGGIDKAPVSGNADEPKAEELPDGSVLLAARGRYGNRNFDIFRYTDVEKGEGRWDNPVNTDMGFGTINACDGEIMILPVVDNATNEQCYLALQSFPYGGGRNYVSIAYKPLKTAADIATPSAFTTWEGRFLVDNGPSVYSTMTWQKNNTIGFLYESNNCDGVYFNFTVEYITNGAYTYSEDTDNAVANSLRDALVTLRSESYGEMPANGYVGEAIDPQGLENALAAYQAEPSAETYVALNAAEYKPEVIVPLSKGIYRFISAHGTTYSGSRTDNDLTINRDEPVYLACDGTNLIPTNDIDHEGALFSIHATDSGKWHIYNTYHQAYVSSAPAVEAKFAVVAEPETPEEFRIVSDTNGETYLEATTRANNSYGCLHLGGSNKIVPWTNSAQASKWHMQLVDDSNVDTSIAEIDAATETVEAYFDLQGRRVANPARGLFITTRGRKILK